MYNSCCRREWWMERALRKNMTVSCCFVWRRWETGIPVKSRLAMATGKLYGKRSRSAASSNLIGFSGRERLKRSRNSAMWLSDQLRRNKIANRRRDVVQQEMRVTRMILRWRRISRRGCLESESKRKFLWKWNRYFSSSFLVYLACLWKGTSPIRDRIGSANRIAQVLSLGQTYSTVKE